MTAKPSYGKHLACLAAVFILGDSIMVLPPPESGRYTFWGFLAAVAAAFLLFLAALPLSNALVLKSGKNIFLRALSALFLTAAALYAFYNAGLVLKRYMNFVDKVLLPDTHKFFIAFIFLLITAFLATRRQEVILKFSLIFVIISVITVLLFFLLSVKDFRQENIAVYRLPSLSELLHEAKPYFFAVSLPAALIPVYEALFTGKTRLGAPFSGLTTGLLLVSLCIVDCLLLFGAPFSARLDFPLASAVSTITVGPLFTRMDGVVYCLFFGSALIKTAVCMKLSFFALSALKSTFRKRKKQPSEDC